MRLRYGREISTLIKRYTAPICTVISSSGYYSEAIHILKAIRSIFVRVVSDVRPSWRERRRIPFAPPPSWL